MDHFVHQIELSHLDHARAWKDAEYRENLTAEELASLPQNPAGMGELSDVDLGLVSGGQDATNTEHVMTLGCCGGFTTDPGLCTFNCDTIPS